MYTYVARILLKGHLKVYTSVVRSVHMCRILRVYTQRAPESVQSVVYTVVYTSVVCQIKEMRS